jgi:hypothetical protein
MTTTLATSYELSSQDLITREIDCRWASQSIDNNIVSYLRVV